MAVWTMDSDAEVIHAVAAKLADEALTRCEAESLTHVPIAILASLEGTMAGNERGVAKACLLAVERINACRDLLPHHQLIPRLFNGKSTTEGFRIAVEKMQQSDYRFHAAFGCWTSASRKMVQGLFRRIADETGRQILLFYPVQFEGLEHDAWTVYGGALPNQQLRPVLRWQSELLKLADPNDSSDHMKCFVVGSDYVYPRASAILVEYLLGRFNKAHFPPHFIPFSDDPLNDSAVSEFIARHVIPAIKDERPHFILNFINGDANFVFFS